MSASRMTVEERVVAGESFPMVVYDGHGSYTIGPNTTWKPKDDRPYIILTAAPAMRWDRSTVLRGKAGRAVRYATRAAAEQRIQRGI